MSRLLLIVVNHAGFFVSHRLPIALAAREKGFDVHIATPRSKHVPIIRQAGFTWHEVPLRRSTLNPFAEIRAVAAIFFLYRRLKPDLVHHVTAKPVLYGTIAARVAGIKHVVNALAGLGHLFQKGDSPRVLAAIAGVAYRLALRHRHMRVIFQNEDDLAVFVDRQWIKPEEAVLIRGSGVDMAAFVPTAERHGSQPLVVFPSRMLYTKGVADFVEAARRLRRSGVVARFALVGDADPENPASVPQELLDRWVDEGAVEAWGRRLDMAAVFASADIVVLPTFYGEGVPKALIEAAACGLPIVTTDTPGCRDIVRDGINGYLVPIHSPTSVADALQKLIANPDLRATMGRAGRQIASEAFSLDRVTDATLAVYRELLA